MKSRSIVAVCLLVLPITGCQRGQNRSQVGEKEVPPVTGDVKDAAGKDGMRVQPRLGDGDEESWGQLDFDITAVHKDRKLLEARPWHAKDGDWTILECRTQAPNPVDFLVGVRTKRKGVDVISAWGEATLLVSDRAAGERIVEIFSRAFHHESPKARKPQPLQGWKFGTAILGEDLRRAPKGGFDGEGGGWNATKWFPEIDGFNAEVFFNYNLRSRKGEFSEKDPDYREDLLAAFATALRDGPRPDRTPKTDPNLTDTGPKIQEVARLSPKADHFSFSPNGKWIVYCIEGKGVPSKIIKIDPRKPSQKVEITQIEKRIAGLTIADDDANKLLIEEEIPKDPSTYSSDDPQRLWWINHAQNERVQLQGPWGEKHLNLGDKPVSPEGRYIAIGSWRPRSDDKGNYRMLYIHDRREATTKTIDMRDKHLELVGWLQRDSGLKVVFAEGSRWEKGSKLHYYLADPATGKYQSVDPSPLQFSEAGKCISRDGSLVAELQGKNKLLIVDKKAAQQRVFTFHEDDVRHVSEEFFDWVSSRYVRFSAPRLALLDVETLKMNYPVAKSKVDSCYTFSPDFRWVLWSRAEKGLFLGKVTDAEN
jgi:hypothetical protein